MVRDVPVADGLFAIVLIVKNLEIQLMIRIPWILATAILICGTMLAVGSHGERGGDGGGIRAQDFRIGFAGHYKLGHWTPAFIALDAPVGTELTLRLTVPDGDGVPTTTRVQHIVPPHPQNTFTTVELLCKVGRPKGEIQLEILRGDRRLLREQYRIEETGHKPFASTTEMILSLGAAANVQAASKQVSQSGESRRIIVEIDNLDQLPTQSLGFDGVDQIFCSSSRPLAQKFVHSAPHRMAVESWVRWGGSIVLSTGATDTDLLAGADSFASFLPGRFVSTVAARQLRPLEILSDESDPLVREDDSGRNISFEIPVFEMDRGRLESSIRQGGQTVPLLVQSALGLGQVTLLAVDLEQPEFKMWNGTRNVIRKVLSLDQQSTGKRLLGRGGELAHQGYDDLAGQLRAALDQFESQGVQFIPFELLFLCGIIYVSVITAGDYFLLRKMRGRMELTWISFPLTVVLFSVVIYLVARTTKGNRQLINQAEVIDIDLISGQERSLCWFSLFSPQTKRYDLSASYVKHRESAAHHGSTLERERDFRETKHRLTDRQIFSWMGLPGRGLGGMESPLATPVFESGYQYSPHLTSLERVPISIWSTKCFSIRTQRTGAQAVEADLTKRSSGEDNLLKGSITNRLTQPLRDCVLLHDGWAYSLGTLKPGESHSIDRDPSVRTIRNHLARLGPMELESELQRLDAERILERMLFYQAAEGGNTIALSNDYLNGLDMSHLLEQGAAILIGLADRRAFEIHNGDQALSDAESLRAAIYRIVLPIGPPLNFEKKTSGPQRVEAPGNSALFVREDPS